MRLYWLTAASLPSHEMKDHHQGFVASISGHGGQNVGSTLYGQRNLHCTADECLGHDSPCTKEDQRSLQGRTEDTQEQPGGWVRFAQRLLWWEFR